MSCVCVTQHGHGFKGRSTIAKSRVLALLFTHHCFPDVPPAAKSIRSLPAKGPLPWLPESGIIPRMGASSEKDPLYDEEWEEWYRMTPLQRWEETQKLWAFYLHVGGSLDPEPDSQSPFDPGLTSQRPPVVGRPGLRIIRRSGV